MIILDSLQISTSCDVMKHKPLIVINGNVQTNHTTEKAVRTNFRGSLCDSSAFRVVMREKTQ